MAEPPDYQLGQVHSHKKDFIQMILAATLVVCVQAA